MVVSDRELGVATPEKRKELIKRLFGKEEKFPVVEIPQVPEIPPEIEKAQPISGAATSSPQPIIDDQTGQVVLVDPTTQTPKIVLPLTQEEIEKGLTVQVIESIRWLAEWCLRMIKKVRGKIKPQQ